MTLVAVKLPSCVVTVTVAVPAATPVTTPALLTVTTPVLLDVHDTFWLTAPDGVIVAVSVWVPVAVTVAVVGLTATPVTAVGAELYQVVPSYQPLVPPRYRFPVWLLPSLNITLSEVILVNV